MNPQLVNSLLSAPVLSHTPALPISLTSILILSSNLHLDLQVSPLMPGKHFSSLPRMTYVPPELIPLHYSNQVIFGERYRWQSATYRSFIYEHWSVNKLTMYTYAYILGRGQLKCDGTRAENRLRLSAKRKSPFKSAGVGGRQFSRFWQPRCAHQR